MTTRRTFRPLNVVLGLCVLLAAGLSQPTVLSAKDRVTVYHPSPFGKYDYLRLFPRPALSNPCQIGMLYTEEPDRLRFCGDDGTGLGEWQDVAGGVWEQNGDLIFPKDNTNPNLQILIGTTNMPPLSSRLTIEGTDPNLSPSLTQLLLRNTNLVSKRSEVHFKSSLPSGGWRLGTDVDANGSDNFFLWGDSAPRLFIDNAGHIGLNTTNPSYDLDLGGNAEIIIEAPEPSLEFVDNNNVDLKIYTASDNRFFWAFNDGSGYKNAFVFDADTGHVGLHNVDWPQGRFHFGDPNSFTYDYASDSMDRLRGLFIIEGDSPALILLGENSATAPASAALLFPQVDPSTGAYKASWTVARETTANGGDLFIGFAEGNDDVFALTQSRLRLTRTGRLSIGPVANPQGDLHIRDGNIMLVGLDGSSVLAFSGPDPTKTFTFSRTPGLSNTMRIAGGWPVNFTLDIQKGAKRISIGSTTLYSNTLFVDGKARKDSGGNTWATPSDARLKTNIAPIEHALDMINKLNGVRFRWKKDSSDAPVRFGFIAQDVEKVFPEWVESDDDGYKTLNTSALDALLVRSLQELDAAITDLENDVLLDETDLKEAGR